MLIWAALLRLQSCGGTLYRAQSKVGTSEMTGFFRFWDGQGCCCGILVSSFLGDSELSWGHRIFRPMGISAGLFVILVVAAGLIVIDRLVSRRGADGAQAEEVSSYEGGRGGGRVFILAVRHLNRMFRVSDE